MLLALPILALALAAPAADSTALIDAVVQAVGARARTAAADSVVVDVLRVPGLRERERRGGAPAVSYRVPSLPAGMPRGPLTVMVEEVVNGTVTARLPVSCLVRTFGTVLVAARNFDRHEPLGPEGLISQTVETTRLPVDRLADPSALAGMRTKRIINLGAVLCASLCEPLPAVRQGDEVTLIARRNGVKLTMQALAKQDGTPGTVILVQPSGTHDRLRARVIDARSVELAAN